ncbi:MAG TPA: hypothetical protein VF638_00850 [Sphingomonas sp.]|jgi:hypothetical protein
MIAPLTREDIAMYGFHAKQQANPNLSRELTERELKLVVARVDRDTRKATVDYDRGFIGLDWCLTIDGKGQGCLATRHRCRYRYEADALEAGRIWVRTGVSPAHQKPSEIAELAPKDGVQ